MSFHVGAVSIITLWQRESVEILICYLRSTKKMAKGKVVLLPIPTAGHIMPMLELAKLLHRYHFSVSVLIAPLPAFPVDDCIATVAASGLDIDFRHLQPVDPPKDADGFEDFISAFMEKQNHHIKSALRDLLRSCDVPLAALIVDFFATSAIDVAAELGVPCYVYYTCNAASLALMLYLPTLDEKFPVEFEEMEEVRVPGVCPIPPIWMPSPLMRKKSGRYTCFVHHGRRYSKLKGIVINTFTDLEPSTLRALEEGLCSPGRRATPVYPVGPLFAREDGEKNRHHECVAWLDGQPASSVVFLCFGSKGCFDAAQVGEIAVGLERSGCRFLWALRVASEEEALGMPNPEDAKLDEVLPEGFLERTKARGMVWPSWAPQADILAHRAVGGFVTHCGWNSCLESLQCGVPLLGWPLYAEQHFNALVMAEDMGVALQLKVERAKANFVTAEELERGVRTLMGDSEEGRRVRAKAEEMMAAAKKAREEGGSSFVNTEALARELLA